MRVKAPGRLIEIATKNLCIQAIIIFLKPYNNREE